MDWQVLGMASGTALAGAAALQASAAALLGRRRATANRRATNQRRAQFDSRLQAALQWAQATKPVFRAWSGTRTFRVAAIVDEARDCKSFYLVPEDGCPLPHFQPGQYLTFQVPIDPRQKPLVRCYSLSERPREDFYRVSVKHARAPRGQTQLPDGRGSGYFHQRVGVGGTLEVQAPQGAFFLDPTSDLPVVLIGGGIGVTPLLSMASEIGHRDDGQAAYLFLGFGNSSEHPFREQIGKLRSDHERLQVDICYSRPMPADLLGRDYHHRGRVDLSRLQDVLPSSNYQFYVCGPPAMMETLVPELLAWGVPESHLHFEAFGPASVKKVIKQANASAIAQSPCKVRFASSGTDLQWDGSCESLLELAEQQGVLLDYGCRAGNCGQCLVGLREGTVEHVKEPGVPLSKSECLTCIGVPAGDVVLEA